MTTNRTPDPPAERLRFGLRRFGCRIDGDPSAGGTAVVHPVRDADGRPLMLKLLAPAAARLEAIALHAFPASASVRCVDHDDDLGALLLERLTATSLAGADPDLMITVQAELARSLAVADPGGGIGRLSDTSGWLDHLDGLLRNQPRLLPARTVGAAREAIADLAHDPTGTVTHGDLHTINVHRDGEGRWRSLDPSPLIGTIAYESHTVIVERPQLGELVTAGPVELRRRLALFAEVAGVDRELATRLCQARAVSSALHARHTGGRWTDELCWMSRTLTPPAG